MTEPMIRVHNLTIRSANGLILDDVSVSIGAGECVGLVGESGSGKTTLGLALMGFLRPGLDPLRGNVFVDGHDMLALAPSALRRVRGRTISYLPQDPAAALTPTMRIHRQIRELAGAGDDVAARLMAVGLPGDPEFLRRYPHQLSGGQQQRLAIARTVAGDPRVLIADEPTTGLDAIAQNLVLDQIELLVRERGLTLVFITHDLAAAARMSERVIMLSDGKVAADGPAREVLVRNPVTGRRTTPSGKDKVLEVSGLRAGFRKQTVVHDVSFSVGRGECVALFGQSGSGKTTIARCLTGVHEPSGGTITLRGEPLARKVGDRPVDIRRRIQVVPQDSSGSLNPRRSVGAAIARPLKVLHGFTGAAAVREVSRLLSLVELDPSLASRTPGQLSGGQRQRVTIARALAARPEVLVCDEMTSSLDVRVQAAVLDLVDGLRRDLGLALVLITHDLDVLARMADRVLVLRHGEVCEEGPGSAYVDGGDHFEADRDPVGGVGARYPAGKASLLS